MIKVQVIRREHAESDDTVAIYWLNPLHVAWIHEEAAGCLVGTTGAGVFDCVETAENVAARVAQALGQPFAATPRDYDPEG